MPTRALRRLALALPLVATASLHAQFNAIGFEGTTIQNIPYDLSVGIPANTPVNTAFNYTFKVGNNLQNFQGGNNTVAGGFGDTDDVGWTVASESGNIPDYYRSPEFLWRNEGFKTTPTSNSDPGWDTGFNATISLTDGYNRGGNLPGGTSPRTGDTNSQYSEYFSINRDFSTSGNIPAAPGLGSQFLDTHLYPGVSSQFALSFSAATTTTYYTTFAFGGRDNGGRGDSAPVTNSVNERAYYRIFDVTSSTTVLSGDTTDMPFEAYAKDGPGVNTSHSVTPVANAGVIQTNWEYFKGTFNVTAGHNYKIQIMMANEINFDMAIGTNYTNIASITGGVITPVPEPSTYGVVGVGMAAGFALLRRRRFKSRAGNVI